MKIKLDLDKSLEENASKYFEKAKKAQKKIEGAEEAVKEKKQEMKRVEKRVEKSIEKPAKRTVKRERAWYEKFKWCYSSTKKLMIGGRDATTNDMIIKKHTEKGDLVFHTDMSGSPFVVVKAEGEEISEETKEEVAQFCASYSKAWGKGYTRLEVFYVKPEQVTKEPESGEYLPRGAFMIRGDTSYLNPELKLAAGKYEDEKYGKRIMCGPPRAIKKNCDSYVELSQGRKKKSVVAKKIREKIFPEGDLDQIIAVIPAGGLKISGE